MPMRVHQESRFGLVDALNAEWERWSQDAVLDRHNRAEIARWAGQYAALRGCAGPADVLTAIRHSPDEVLAALIAVHQESAVTGTQIGHHPLAGRIIVQTMLGKLVSMAARDRRCGVEDYVGQLWVRIAGYPLAARPRRIAANLSLDTLKAVVADRSEWAAADGAAVPVAPEVLEQTGLQRHASIDPVTERFAGQVADLTGQRVLRTAVRIGLVDEATRRLLHAVYLDGMTSAEAGDRHGLSAPAVRSRCSVAVRRLARHAEEIADAA